MEKTRCLGSGRSVFSPLILRLECSNGRKRCGRPSSKLSTASQAGACVKTPPKFPKLIALASEGKCGHSAAARTWPAPGRAQPDRYVEAGAQQSPADRGGDHFLTYRPRHALTVDVLLRSDLQRVGEDGRARMRRRRQPHHMRTQRDATVELVDGGKADGDVDAHGDS